MKSGELSFGPTYCASVLNFGKWLLGGAVCGMMFQCRCARSVGGCMGRLLSVTGRSAQQTVETGFILLQVPSSLKVVVCFFRLKCSTYVFEPV